MFRLERKTEDGAWATYDGYLLAPTDDAVTLATYAPKGWGGHGRANRDVEALLRGKEVTNPLGTWRIVKHEEVL